MTHLYFVRHAQPEFEHEDDRTRSLTKEGMEDRKVVLEVLTENENKNIVIGTHGTAFSTIMNYYLPEFDCDDFFRIIDWMPYIVQLKFNGQKLVSVSELAYVEKEFKAKAR